MCRKILHVMRTEWFNYNTFILNPMTREAPEILGKESI